MKLNIKNNPMLKDIPQEKLEAISAIIEKSGEHSNKELITYLMNSASLAGQKGINFSNAETELIINALKSNMNPEEQKRVDALYNMAHILSKKQANS